MRIYELISGEPTPQATQPLGPQSSLPQGANLPQPPALKAAAPVDAPSDQQPPQQVAAAGQQMPTMYIPWGQTGSSGWPLASSGDQMSISPHDAPDPRFGSPGGVSNDNSPMRVVTPR